MTYSYDDHITAIQKWIDSRLKTEFTAEGLAQLVGVSTRTIHYVRGGEVKPSGDTLQKFDRAMQQRVKR
jgi:hypothetical protein